MPGLCECGCGQATRLAPQTDTAKGWVRGQPLRFVTGHNTRGCILVVPPVVDENGCWIWQGGRSDNGYGQTSRDGKTFGAHVAWWERQNGPVPQGLQLDHLCRNRACVNPAPNHLEPVTCRENLLRGETLAAQNLAKTHCPKGHPYSGGNLRIRIDGARVCRACAREAARQARARVT